MLDTCKEYLARKRFGIVAYVCVIVHFICGVALIVVVANLRASENGKFSCSVIDKAPTTYQKKVDQACFARYDQAYNSPLPLYGFVPLSFGVAVLISVIYSLVVSKRVDEIESDIKRQTDGEDGNHNHGPNRRTVFVIYSYFAHLVLRALLGIIFTVLQHTYFYRDGFDFKFLCNLPSTILTSNDQNTPKNVSRNDTSVTCENSTSSEKCLSGIIVSVINCLVAFVILAEVIYLLPRLPILNGCFKVGWSSDHQFVTVYFLRKRYLPVTFQLPTIECFDFYKQQVLNRRLASDINYKQKRGLDDFYVDVVIHTARAKREFSKKIVDRHEIYDVYTKIPFNSIRLEKIKDLFYPNKDTEGKYPRSILAIGRPGIGKTVLTEKIIRDWANGVDEFYTGKVAFVFEFRLVNENVSGEISLKEFLQFGTRLSIEKFESIYEEIIKEPKKAILIFDGLDEFHHGDHISCIQQSAMIPNNPNTRMSAMNLFVKLTLGDLLKGATVLVTSRPTADDFYSKLDFDRSVEIIGFTHEKIEQYVKNFCNDNHTEIWKHIKSSQELLNLCYIPVNSFIVCVTLSGCLSDHENYAGALPTTLTELYQNAINHVEKYHNRNKEQNPITHEDLRKLQHVAFLGMENGQLVFKEESFDDQMSYQMRKSGLINSLSNPIFPLQTQFCFVHLTVQEFLAARHVTESKEFTPPQINKFISDHIKSSKWHLVVQFIAGLLGQKMERWTKYNECFRTFTESFKIVDNEIKVTEDNHNEFILKCLKEVDDEDVFETISISEDVKLNIVYEAGNNTGEFAVPNFALKHMKNLADLHVFSFVSGDLQEILEILRTRCLNKFNLVRAVPFDTDPVFSALMNSQCLLNHNHTKLTSFKLFFDFMVSPDCMYNFFRTGHGNQLIELKSFRLWKWGSRPMPFQILQKLCEVFKNEFCPELTQLELGGMGIRDESVLWDTLWCKGLCNLAKLSISRSPFSIKKMCKALQDERCQLTTLSVSYNDKIGDEGLRMLCEEALTKKHCKLTGLTLEMCRLTSDCISSLVKALLNEDCKLVSLSLDGNRIGDAGASTLFTGALSNQSCRLTELSLQECSLTDCCVPSLRTTLQDKCCALKRLDLYGNDFTENSKTWLRREATRGLEISFDYHMDYFLWY